MKLRYFRFAILVWMVTLFVIFYPLASASQRISVSMAIVGSGVFAHELFAFIVGEVMFSKAGELPNDAKHFTLRVLHALLWLVGLCVCLMYMAKMLDRWGQTGSDSIDLKRKIVGSMGSDSIDLQ
jgi:hypothetical protein